MFNNTARISNLKQDNFYEKADGLVGVCRDPDHGCSKTFTFELSNFEPPAEME